MVRALHAAVVRGYEALTAGYILRGAERDGLRLEQPSETDHAVSAMPTTSAHAVRGLWERSLQELGDPLFPLRCSRSATDEARSLVTLVAMVTPTLGEVIRRMVHYWPLVTDTFAWKASRAGDVVTLVADMRPDATLGERCNMEFHTSDLMATGQALTRGAVRYRRVSLAHRPPKRAACAFAERLATRLCVGAARVEIVAEAPADLPVAPHVEPALARFILSLADRALAERRREPTFVERVEGAIERELRPSLATVSKSLGVSARTLHRRLHQQGTCFQKLTDEALRKRAEGLLASPELSSEQIAAAIGMSRRAFFRAVRRWTGTTPRDYRGQKQVP